MEHELESNIHRLRHIRLIKAALACAFFDAFPIPESRAPNTLEIHHIVCLDFYFIQCTNAKSPPETLTRKHQIHPLTIPRKSFFFWFCS